MVHPKLPVICNNGFVLVWFQVDSLANSSKHFDFLENSFSQNSESSACTLAQRSMSEKQSVHSKGHWLSSIHPAGEMEAVLCYPMNTACLELYSGELETKPFEMNTKSLLW